MSWIDQLRIPIWREGRVALERAALLRDPVLTGEGIPCGDGAPVLLVPGFLAGDMSLGLMGDWLERIGYQPCRAGIRANVDCATRALERLEHELESFAERHCAAVSVIGHSRGGTMARILAVRRPDLVEGIVCLGSPIADELAVHPFVRAHVEAVAVLGSLGLPGLFSYSCHFGACCAVTRAQAMAPFPVGVRFVSVYSRSDGIVDWHACVDPVARMVEVRSSHVGMAVNGDVFRVIAEALAHQPATENGSAGAVIG